MLPRVVWEGHVSPQGFKQQWVADETCCFCRFRVRSIHWKLLTSPFDAHCCHIDTAMKHPVPERVKLSFVCNFWHLGTLTLRGVNGLNTLTFTFHAGCQHRVMSLRVIVHWRWAISVAVGVVKLFVDFVLTEHRSGHRQWDTRHHANESKAFCPVLMHCGSH